MDWRALRRRTALLLLCWIPACVSPAWAAGAEAGTPAGKQVRLLAVGNSFSGNATRFLKDLVAASGGNRLTFAHAYIGGCPLDKHVRLAEAFEKDAQDPAGPMRARPVSATCSRRRSGTM